VPSRFTIGSNSDFADDFSNNLACAARNPKGIAFFLGLFAAAVPEATPLWAKLAVLSADPARNPLKLQLVVAGKRLKCSLSIVVSKRRTTKPRTRFQ
jgi:hypothetical protein